MSLFSYWKSYSHNRAPDSKLQQTFMRLVGQGKDVLEIGCGEGAYTTALSMDNLLVAADLLLEAITACKKNGLHKLICFNAESPWPLADGQFDVVFSNGVLEFLFSAETVVAEMARILRPEGSVVITVLNHAAWHRRVMLLLAGRLISVEGNGFSAWNAPVLRLYTRASIVDLFTKHGFECSHCIGFGTNFPAQLNPWLPKSIRKPLDIFTRFTGGMEWAARVWPSLFADSLVLRFQKGK